MSTGEPGDAGAQPLGFAPIARLTGESERRLQALRRGLRRADGFTLYFVLASGAARAEVLRRLKAWSGKDGTPEMRFLPEGDECARATLKLLEREDPALPLRGVVIPHAEALLDVEGGAAIAALNLARDILGGIVEGPLVLALPADRAGELPRAAPDLFDVRSGMFEVEAVPVPGGTSEIAFPGLPTGPQRSPEELTAAAARLQALTAAPEPPPAGALADAWLKMGWQLWLAARWDEASRAAQEARRLSESVGYWSGIAQALVLKGDVERFTNHLSDAKAAYEDAVTIYRSMADRLGEANALEGLGNLFADIGRLEDAANAYSEALALYKEVNARRSYANTLEGLGDLLIRTDRFQEARKIYSEALAMHKMTQDRLGEANTLLGLGKLALASHQPAEAFDWMLQALSIHQQVEPRVGVANDHLGLARAAAALGHPLRAVVLGGRALAMYRALKNGHAQMLQARDLAEPLLALEEDTAAAAALLISWALAADIGHRSADDLRARLTTLNPSFNPVVPPPEPLLAEAREQLQAALARCEARLAEAGEDPYAPLDAPSA